MAVLQTAGRGLAAGFAGAVALTASQRIEMKLTGRPASDLPAKVAEAALGISPRGRARERVAFVTHWVNNTSSGLGRAGLAAAGLTGARAAAATSALYLTGSWLLFATLRVAPPPWRLGARQLAIETIHAAVYGTATSVAYDALERRDAA